MSLGRWFGAPATVQQLLLGACLRLPGGAHVAGDTEGKMGWLLNALLAHASLRAACLPVRPQTTGSGELPCHRLPASDPQEDSTSMRNEHINTQSSFEVQRTHGAMHRDVQPQVTQTGWPCHHLAFMQGR